MKVKKIVGGEMANCSIKIQEVLQVVDEYNRYKTELNRLKQEIREIKRNTSIKMKFTSGVNGNLKSIISEIDSLERTVNSMENALENSVNLYLTTENAIVSGVSASIINEEGIQRESIFRKYYHEFEGYVGGTVNSFLDNYVKISPRDTILGIYDWIRKDVFGEFNDKVSFVEDVLNDYIDGEIEILPEGYNVFFDTLSKGQIFIDILEEVEEYNETGDKMEAFSNISHLILDEVFSAGDKKLDKMMGNTYTSGEAEIKKLLGSIIVDMPYNLAEEFENNKNGAGSIWMEAIYGTIVENTAEFAEPYYKEITEGIYPIVDHACELMNYDLSGEYERLSNGETGMDAVYKLQKEIWVDIVYEGSKERGAEILDGFYESVDNSWEAVKAGIGRIF
jgi:hypothetical protein